MRKTHVCKGDGCYTCGGLHGYASCPELKSLVFILRERKEKDEHEQDQVEETKKLGLKILC